MNITFLTLYVIAAVVLVYVLVRTYFEKDRMSIYVAVPVILALVCVLGYSVNFMTDDYKKMSCATSIMMAAQDFALVALLVYTSKFTRIGNKATKIMAGVSLLLAIADSVVFIINIFDEIALKYSLNKCNGCYVLGYEGEVWFAVHAIINLIIVAMVIGLLVVKCMRIPGAYWGRYTFMGIGLFIILVFKFIFIAKMIDLRVDISILLYAFLGVLIYWNTFWYSKKTMLNVTHEMIIDHMQVPVILFDYEGVVADFNVPMHNIFDDLMYDNREQTYSWFIENKHVPVEEGADTFEWNLKEHSYDCRIVNLSDNKGRLLGKIIVMQDVSELKKAYRELQDMVVFDSLTGVFSKLSYLDNCKNYDDFKGPVSVAVCNVNSLNDINIRYGQKAGDSVMINVADVLKSELKNNAYIARLNGSDFAIVLKNYTKERAETLLSGVKDKINRQCSTKDYKVTVEYGISVRDNNNKWMMDVTNKAAAIMKEKKAKASAIH